MERIARSARPSPDGKIELANGKLSFDSGFTAGTLTVEERDGKTVVIGKVSGDFPNSPVQLQHIFGLEGDKIVSLEIR